jgi:uncharacterized protein YjbI with pentapeptide repeats
MIQIKNRFTSKVIIEVPDLVRVDLRKANLSEANLCDADLRGADLSEANMYDALLRDAVLSWSGLRGAVLSSADLGGAVLRNADLRGADLDGANLSDAELLGSRGVVYYQMLFPGDGDTWQRLLAVKISEQIMFFCGRFKGTEAELRSYIENGQENLKASRIVALETCLKAIEFQPNY